MFVVQAVNKRDVFFFKWGWIFRGTRSIPPPEAPKKVGPMNFGPANLERGVPNREGPDFLPYCVSLVQQDGILCSNFDEGLVTWVFQSWGTVSSQKWIPQPWTRVEVPLHPIGSLAQTPFARRPSSVGFLCDQTVPFGVGFSWGGPRPHPSGTGPGRGPQPQTSGFPCRQRWVWGGVRRTLYCEV